MICTVPGCERPHYAKGYCRLHYYRAKHGLPLDASTHDLRVMAGRKALLVLSPEQLRESGRKGGLALSIEQHRTTGRKGGLKTGSANGRLMVGPRNGSWSGRRIGPKYDRLRIRRRATCAVQYALAQGWLVRGPCEVCGAKKAHAHHDSYLEPLEVTWLCPKHHTAWHKKHQAILKEAV
jgi:hypothetical protein